MKTTLRISIIIVLALAGLACRLQLFGGDETPEFGVLETAAQQTITARQTQDAVSAAAATALAQALTQTESATGVIPTFIPGVTQTAVLPTADMAGTAAAQATSLAGSAQATSLAGSAQATTAALSAAATQASLAATLTAFAPVQPPPPVQPPAQRPLLGRIRFAPGATSGTTGGELPAGVLVDYLIAASDGQTMLASVYSANSDVHIGVTGVSDGSTLQNLAARSSTFTGRLPATQDYRITLAAPTYPTAFTLQVIIPARIQFAPGAIFASIPGQLAGGEVNYYLAQARAGQTMTVRIISPNNDIFLTIYGMIDGSPLVRALMGQNAWSGSLPLTQDYMIQAVSTGPASNYTLEIVIQ